MKENVSSMSMISCIGVFVFVISLKMFSLLFMVWEFFVELGLGGEVGDGVVWYLYWCYVFDIDVCYVDFGLNEFGVVMVLDGLVEKDIGSVMFFDFYCYE